MASSSNINPREGATNFIVQWRNYRKEMTKYWPELHRKIDKHDVKWLERELEPFAEKEFEYIRKTNYDSDDFVRVLMYRPDIGHRVYGRLKSDEYISADYIGNAMEAAGWPLDYMHLWTSDPGSELDGSKVLSAVSVLRKCNVLAGEATVGVGHLLREGVISEEDAFDINKLAPFSYVRAEKFAFILRKTDAETVKTKVLRRNPFLQRVFREAAKGELSEFILEGLPKPVPDYFIDRTEMKQIRSKLLEAIKGEKQKWVEISGQDGVGKTVLAKQLATECSGCLVIWIPFEGTDAESIYRKAKDVLREFYPGADADGSAKQFIQKILTKEGTQNIVIFLDDVRDEKLLEPFELTKTVVYTSSRHINIPEVHVEPIEVPLNLKKEECMKIFEKVLGEENRKLFEKELSALSRTVHCNALATTASAAYLKRRGEGLRAEDVSRLSENIGGDPEKQFKAMTAISRIDVGDNDKDHMNIYRVLSLVISNLSEREKRAFESLIVFRRNAPIVVKVFKKVNDTDDGDDDDDRLIALHNKGLLQKKDDHYEMQDLCRDVLEAKLTKEQRQKHFRKLMAVYEGNEMDSYFLEYIAVCLEADRADVAEEKLTSAKYILARFSQFRFANIMRDFDAVLQMKDSESVASARAFLSDAALWHHCEDRISLLRQAVLFDRGPTVDRKLLALAREEAAYPLFRTEEQKMEKVEEHFRETARQKFDQEVKCLALNKDGEGLVATPEGLVMLLSPQLEILEKQPLGEGVVSAGPLASGWVLVMRKRCLAVKKDLQKEREWSVGKETDVLSAAVSSEGGVAVLKVARVTKVPEVPEQRLVLTTAATEKVTEVNEFPSDRWQIGCFAVTARALAAVYVEKCERRKVKLLVKELSEGSVTEEMEMEMEMEKVKRCCFVSDDKLLIWCKWKQFLINWKKKKIEEEEQLSLSSSFPLCNLRSSPDGRLAAAIHFDVDFDVHFLSVIDPLSFTQIFDTRQMKISVKSFSISNAAVIVSSVRNEIVLLRLSSVTFPVPVSRYEHFLAVLGFRKDFALFCCEGSEMTVKASDGSELFRWPIPDWESVRVTVSASGDDAVIWEEKGHRLASVELRKGVRKDFRSEGIICVVTLSCGLLAVGDESGAVLVRNEGALRRLMKVPEKIRKLFVFSSAVGVLFSFSFSFFSFQIFDLRGRKEFEMKKVLSVAVTSCGHRVTVLLREEVLEVSEKGEHLRRFSHSFSRPRDALCLPDDGLLVWNWNGDGVIVRGEQQLKVKFPERVEAVQFAQDGALAAVRTADDVWLLDLSSGARELLWSFDVTELRVRELFFSPSWDRLLLRSDVDDAVFLRNVTSD